MTGSLSVTDDPKLRRADQYQSGAAAPQAGSVMVGERKPSGTCMG
jgi:hypothetical protein